MHLSTFLRFFSEFRIGRVKIPERFLHLWLLLVMDKSVSKFELTPDWVLRLTDAQPRLYGFLLKRLGNSDQAQEVLQEVNLVMCRNADAYQAGTDFMAWAFSVARFQVLAFRKRQSRDRLVFPSDLFGSLESLDEDLYPHELAEIRQLALRECMKSLPDHQTRLVSQRYGQSMTVKSIADELGKSANAVSIVLHRVREQLMKCVQQRLLKEETL